MTINKSMKKGMSITHSRYQPGSRRSASQLPSLGDPVEVPVGPNESLDLLPMADSVAPKRCRINNHDGHATQPPPFQRQR